MPKSKRGRRAQGEYVGKSLVLSFRIVPETKAALEKSARESRRSVSQQTEHLLRRQLFEHGSEETYAVLRTAALAIDSLTKRAPGGHWLDDPYLFDQAKKVLITTLDLLRPRAPIPANDGGSQRQGEIAAHETVRDVLIADESTPRVRQTKEQRALLMLKADLARIVGRAHPYGKTTAQLRQEQKINAELRPLFLKAKANELTAKESLRLARLLQQQAALQKPLRRKP